MLPQMESLNPSGLEQNIKFNFEKEFNLSVNEDLIDFCSDGAIPIHVLGQRSDLLEDRHSSSADKKVKSLEDGWDMVSRRLELSMAVLELNDNGEYEPVEVAREEGGTAGIFQLRHGQQKRLSVQICPLKGLGSLPLELDSILNVSVGCPCVRNKADKAMDSYQEEDLNQLREKWSQALDIRKIHLQTQIQAFLDIPDKSEQEKAREESLLNQLVELMEEQNATYSPPDNSKIPGSLNHNFPALGSGVERHQPVLFLDSESGDNLHDTSIEDELGIPLYGQDSVLPNELGTMFVSHPIVSYTKNGIGCLVSWDSSLHDSPALNRVTNANQRFFMIARVTVRLTQPCIMDIVLRKRFSLIIYKKQSLTDRIWKKLGPVNPQTFLGVVYHLVYNIPRTSSELENRESLAAAAASGQEIFADDGESLVEKYSKGVSAVDELLRTDKVRQHIALKELLTKRTSVKDSRKS